MFVGAIESEFRRFLVLNHTAFQGRTLFVGCSGNFTIEQLVGSVAKEVHSNDVSIYTHFLGHHLAEQPIDWKIKDPSWEWLRPYLTANLGAAVVLLFELLKWNPKKNVYQRRIYDQLRSNWETEFSATATRVEQAKAVARVTTYRSSDIWTFTDEAMSIDPDGIFMAFLPFYKGGYEKLYRAMEEIISWSPPAYEVIDAERKNKLVEKIQRFDHVTIDDVEYPDQPAVMLKRKTATKEMWLYSNLDLTRVLVQPHTKSVPSNYPMLETEHVASITPDSTIIIKRVKAAEINYYRNRYLAKGIVFLDGMWNFLMFVDGRLFGFAILNRDKFGGAGLYLLSDFAAPADKDCRLAKLVLLVMQSTHFRQVCEELVLDRVPLLATTAFTDKPVSQKYRGAGWELMKRGEDASGKKFLNYQTATGLHSDREAIQKWMKSKPKSRN